MKIDYDKIAPNYDNHRRVGGPYMPHLIQLARQVDAKRVLELGCGTGNSTRAFLQSYPCRLVALDPSEGMLSEARGKDLQYVQLLRASATHVPLSDASIQFVFGVFFLHHVSDVAAVARECRRVLSRGAAAFVTASTHFIKSHPMNRYFPSLPAVDRARFRTGTEIQAALRHAHFPRTRVQTCKTNPQPIDNAYVQKVAAKFISTYELIPPQEFQSGLARLKAEVANAGGKLKEEVAWEWTLVTAHDREV